MFLAIEWPQASAGMAVRLVGTQNLAPFQPPNLVPPTAALLLNIIFLREETDSYING
jgi:hypothetical protein